MNAQSRISAGGRSSAKLKVNPITGSLPVLQYCAPEQLLIDESYQRSLDAEPSQALIRRIATKWDWGFCQPLFVARRPDGGLYVVDGQHRLAAAVLRGDIAQLPCVVSHFDSADLEAAAFVALNQQRRPLSAIDLFKAALTAGDPAARRIQQGLNDAGLKLSNHSSNNLMKPGHVCNVGGLQRAERTYGEQILTSSLKVLAKAYPQQVLRYAGSIFPGIVAVVAGELANRTSPGELIERLSAFVGRDQQSDWVRRFAQAKADDVNLKHSQAAERVLRASWVEFSQAELGRRATGGSPQTESFLKPAETDWCDQCDQRRSGAQATACQDKFCKLKAKAPA
jgi:hypothetical protein